MGIESGKLVFMVILFSQFKSNTIMFGGMIKLKLHKIHVLKSRINRIQFYFNIL